MDKRTKILVGSFGLMIAYGLFSSVVYPKWVEPLLTIDDRVAERQEELDKLEEGEKKVAQAIFAYRDYANRAGSMDVGKTEHAVREKLNALIRKYKLKDANVAANRGSKDRTTLITKQVITVTAVGTLESAIKFLRDVEEFPQLARVGNTTIYPSTSSRKRRKQRNAIEMVNLRVPLEVWVLPQQKIVGRKLKDGDLRQPEKFVRHSNRSYADIWQRTPFSEYIPLDPLVVRANRTVASRPGKTVTLSVSATGGDGEYTYLWSPADGLDNPKIARPKLNLSDVGKFDYTATVSDGSGNKDSSTVLVEIVEPPQVAKKPPPPVQPTQPAPKIRGKSNKRRDMVLSVALVSSDEEESDGEIVVYNTKTRDSSFYSLGEEFEGGELVYVHPHGAVVSWEGQYFIYPIGGSLAEDVKADEAEGYPTLQFAAYRHRDAAEVMDEEGSGDLIQEGDDAVELDSAQDKSDPADPKAKPADVPGVQNGKAKDGQKGNQTPDNKETGSRPAAKPAGNAAQAPTRANAKTDGRAKSDAGNRGKRKSPAPNTAKPKSPEADARERARKAAEQRKARQRMIERNRRTRK